MTSRPEKIQLPAQPDYEAVVRAYQAHTAVVYRFFYSRVGNREDAEDLTSQVFLKAVTQLDGARDDLSIKSWLFQLAKTALADHWRQYYKNPRVPLQLLTPDRQQEKPPAPVAAGSAEMLRQVLEQLPDHYRQVLSLRFLEGLSIRETAAEMGVSEGNVKVLQLRALRRAAEKGRHLL